MNDERREFLKVLSAGACATVLGASLTKCGVDAAAQVSGPATDKAGQLKFAQTRFKQLAKVGGAVQIKSDNLPGTLALVMHTSTGYAAVSGICSHQACPLGFNGKQVECPCHASLFTLEGKPTRGPATGSLAHYVVTTDRVTGELLVNTRGAKFPPVVDGALELTVDDIEDLENNGGSVTFLPIGFDRPLIIVRYQTDLYFAYDAEDTVDRSILTYNDETKRLVSEDNGSEYDLQGGVKVPPATTALTVYPTVLSAERVLTITLPV